MPGLCAAMAVRSGSAAVVLAAAAAGVSAAATAAPGSPALSVVASGDTFAAAVRVAGDGIPDVLPGAVAGDPARGRAIVAGRQVGLCLLCHTGPFPEERFQGNLAPDLAGAGARSNAAQLRLRIADASRLNPDTLMPAYFRTGGLDRVALAYRDKPILAAQQIEDVVAFLQTLTDPPEAGRPQ
jgi:L-cysteine S-thiosulfotransferase